MFETDIRKIDFDGKNILKSHHVNLDVDLDCVIVLSSKDEKLSELLYHKIVDAIIDRVHPKNVYKDFSSALENINSFLVSWKHEEDKIKGLHAIIGIYHKKTFLFSTLGGSSCYLYNTHKDVIEVTDKEENPSDFGYISSGDIADGESLLLSNIRLLDILSKDDIADGLTQGNLKRSGENIENILLHEHSGKNIGLLSFRKNVALVAEGKWSWSIISYHILRVFDNTLSKKALGYLYHLRETLFKQTQKTKQIFLSLGILVSIFLLYSVISGFFQIASNTRGVEKSKQELVQAQTLIAQAGENMNNPDMFSLNVTQAQEILKNLETQQLFLDDIRLLRDNMGILQKQFNGVEAFETTVENTVYQFAKPSNIIKVLSIADKIYVVQKNSITGPIIQGEDAQNYSFTQMLENDAFIDATVYESNIVLMTQLGKVVNFAKNNYFSYVDVADQPTWEKSPLIEGYSSNLYLLSDSGTQILRHKKQGAIYGAADSYLTDNDAAALGEISSIAIDGGIYILKIDGSVVKLFREPKYRLETIVLNKLPKNYSFKNLNSGKDPSIRARADLKYIYLLLENKILVFKPNTERYQDVKSLNYLGQIEGKNTIIEDFYIDNDGEIFIASAQGVYKVKFEVLEGKIVLR